MEENGIIRKSAHPSDGRKSIYLLTEKSIGLLPVLIELNFWMAEHDPAGIIASKSFGTPGAPKAEIISVETARLRQEHLI
jgi:DNA-binding HxlR family transcriptional regulator